ncbi:membrane-associated protein, putative, partial [Bodo saltans]
MTFSVATSAWYALCVLDNELQRILAANSTTTASSSLPLPAATLDGIVPAVLSRSTGGSQSSVWSLGSVALGDVSAVPYYKRAGLLFPLFPNTTASTAVVTGLTATSAFEQSLLNATASLDDQLVARDANVTFLINQSQGLSSQDQWIFSTTLSSPNASPSCQSSLLLTGNSTVQWVASGVSSPEVNVSSVTDDAASISSVKVVFEAFATAAPMWNLCLIPSIVSATTSDITAAIWQTLASSVWQTEPQWSSSAALMNSSSSAVVLGGALQQLNRTNSATKMTTPWWTVHPIVPTSAFGPTRRVLSSSQQLTFAIGTNVSVCLSGGRNIEHSEDLVYAVPSDASCTGSSAEQVGIRLSASPEDLARKSNCSSAGGSEMGRSFFFDSSALFSRTPMETSAFFAPSIGTSSPTQLTLTLNALQLLPQYNSTLGLRLCFYSPTTLQLLTASPQPLSINATTSSLRLIRTVIDWLADSSFVEQQFFASGFGLRVASSTGELLPAVVEVPTGRTSSSLTLPILSSLQWMNVSARSSMSLRILPRSSHIDLCQFMGCSSSSATLGETTDVVSTMLCGNNSFVISNNSIVTVLPISLNRTHVMFSADSLVHGYGVLCWDVSATTTQSSASSAHTASTFLASPWATFTPFSTVGFTQKLWPGAGSLPAAKATTLNRFDFTTSSILLLPSSNGTSPEASLLYSTDVLVPCTNTTSTPPQLVVDLIAPDLFFNVTAVNSTCVDLHRATVSNVFADLHVCLLPGLQVFTAGGVEHTTAPLKPWASVAFLPSVVSSLITPSVFTTIRGSVNLTVEDLVGYNWMMNLTTASPLSATLVPCADQLNSGSSTNTFRFVVNTSAFTIQPRHDSSSLFGSWNIAFNAQPTPSGTVSLCFYTPDSRMPALPYSTDGVSVTTYSSAALQQDRLFYVGDVTVDPLLQTALPISSSCDVATNYTVYGAGSVGAAGVLLIKLDERNNNDLLKFSTGLLNATSACIAAGAALSRRYVSNRTLGIYATTTSVAVASAASLSNRTFFLPSHTMSQRGYYGVCYIGPSGDVYSFEAPVILRLRPFAAAVAIPAVALGIYGAVMSNVSTTVVSSVDGSLVTTVNKVVKIFSGVATPFNILGGGVDPALDTIYIVPKDLPCQMSNMVDSTGYGVWATNGSNALVVNTTTSLVGSVWYRATLAPNSDAYLYAMCVQQTGVPLPATSSVSATTTTITTRVPLVNLDAIAVQPSLVVDSTTASRQGAFVIAGPALLNAASVRFSFAYNQQSAQILLGITPTLAFSATTTLTSSSSPSINASSSSISNTSSSIFAIAFPPVVPIPSSSSLSTSNSLNNVSYNISIIADIVYATGGESAASRFVIPVPVEQDVALRRLMNSTWNSAELCSHIPQTFDALTNTLPSWRHTLSTTSSSLSSSSTQYVGFPVVSGPPSLLTVNSATLLAGSLDYTWQLTTATILARNYIYFNCSSFSASQSPDYLLAVMQDIVSRYPALVTDPVTVFSVISEILVDKITSLISTSSVSGSSSNRNSSQVVSQFNGAVAAASGIISNTKTTLSSQFSALNTTAAQSQLISAHEALVASVLDLIAAAPSASITSSSSVSVSSTSLLGLQVVGRMAQLVTAMCSSFAGLLPASSALGSRGALSVATRSVDATKLLVGDGTGISMSLPSLSAINILDIDGGENTNQNISSHSSSQQCVATFPITLPSVIGNQASSIAQTVSTSASRRFSALAQTSSSTTSASLPELNMPLLSFMLAGGGSSSATFLTSPSAYVDVQYEVSSSALGAAWATTIGSIAQGGVGRPKYINVTVSTYRFLINGTSLSAGDVSGFWVPNPIPCNITNAFSDDNGALAYRLFYNNVTPTSTYEALTSASQESQGLVVIGGHYELIPFFDQRFDYDYSVAGVFVALAGMSVLMWLVLVTIAAHRCCSCLLGVRSRRGARSLPRMDKPNASIRKSKPLPPTALASHQPDEKDSVSINSSMKDDSKGMKSALLDHDDDDTTSWRNGDGRGGFLLLAAADNSTTSDTLPSTGEAHQQQDEDHHNPFGMDDLVFSSSPPRRALSKNVRNPYRYQQQAPQQSARRMPPTAAAASGMQPLHPFEQQRGDTAFDWDRASSTTAGGNSTRAGAGVFDDFATTIPWVREDNAEMTSVISTNADDFLSISVGGATPAMPSIFGGWQQQQRLGAADLGSVASTPSGFEDPDRTPRSSLQTITPSPPQQVHDLYDDEVAGVPVGGAVELVEEMSAGSSFRTITPASDGAVDAYGSPYAALGSGSGAVVLRVAPRIVPVVATATPSVVAKSRVERKQKKLADVRLKATLSLSRKQQRATQRHEKELQQYEVDRAEGARLHELSQRDREIIMERTQQSLLWRVVYLLRRLHWLYVAASCASPSLTAALPPSSTEDEEQGSEASCHLIIRRRSLRERCTIVLSILQRLIILAYATLIVMLFCGTYEHAPVMVLLYALMAAALANPVATVVSHLLLRTTIHSYHRIRRKEQQSRQQQDKKPKQAENNVVVVVDVNTAVDEEEERMRK